MDYTGPGSQNSLTSTVLLLLVFYFSFLKYFFIYLVAPGLSCSTQPP